MSVKPGDICTINNIRYVRILGILNDEYCYVEFKNLYGSNNSICKQGDWYIELPVIPISLLKDKEQDTDPLLLLIKHGSLPSIEQRLTKCKLVYEEIKSKAKNYCPKYHGDGSIVQSKDRYQRCIEMGVSYYPKALLEEECNG